MKPTLNNDTPVVVFLQISCNDIPNKRLLTQKLAQDILETGRMPKSKNVNHIFIFSIICRLVKYLIDRVYAVNLILRNSYKANEFIFIDNTNVTKDRLADGPQLN